MPDQERAKERVDELKQAIADSLNRIEGALEMFEFECEDNKWNTDVCYQIKEGCNSFGFALATLVNWYKDEQSK